MSSLVSSNVPTFDISQQIMSLPSSSSDCEVADIKKINCCQHIATPDPARDMDKCDWGKDVCLRRGQKRASPTTRAVELFQSVFGGVTSLWVIVSIYHNGEEIFCFIFKEKMLLCAFQITNPRTYLMEAPGCLH